MVTDWNSFLTMLFGAVGIASLLLSGFAAWLSWQFYKESRGQSDRVGESVNRIESVVNAVQAHIQQIVEKTITSLLSSQGSAAGSISKTDLDDKMAELNDRIAAVIENSKGRAPEALQADLTSFVSSEIEKLESRIREEKIRSLLPEPPRAVDAKVDLLAQDQNLEEGIMTIDVLRPVPIATASWRFTTEFKNKPSLTVEVVSAPNPKDPLKLHGGVSSGKRFNVHLNASAGGVVAPGTYQIKYRAAAEQ